MVIPWELASIGGVNAVVANLYGEFLRHGFLKPSILIQSWEHKKPEFIDENGHNKVRLRIRSVISNENILLSLFIYLLMFPVELYKATRLIRSLNISIINAHYPTLSMFIFVFARYLRVLDVRMVLSFHGTDIKRAAYSGFIEKQFWKWLLSEADAIVPCSKGLAKTLINFAPKIQRKITTIHNGIDVEKFTNMATHQRSLSPQLSKQRVILSVGAFEHIKGHDIIINAFQAMSEKFGDIQLVIVGQTAPAFEETERLVKKLGLQDRCTLVKDAPREVVAAYMSIANLFVLASRSEAFGLVLLEAGAFGVPVVATCVGGIPEVISSQDCGLLVDPDDPAKLAQAMTYLLEHPESAKKIGMNLKLRVQKDFSWEAAGVGYMEVFDRINGLMHVQSACGPSVDRTNPV